MTMDRRTFIKDCLGGACACTALGVAPTLTHAADASAPADWRLPFIQARYARLLGLLSAKVGEDALDDTLRQLGRFCAQGTPLMEKHRGNIDDYIRESTLTSGETITYDRAQGILTITGPERTECFCPLVDHRTCPKAVCNCSKGWLQHVYETVLGQPVEVRLLESVVHGSKRCAFEIRFEPQSAS